MERRYAWVLVTGALAAAAACATPPTPAPTATPTPTPTATATPTPPGTVVPTPAPLPPEARINADYFDYAWRTDFSRHVVPYEEVRFLGLRRDAIAPIYEPVVEEAQQANAWMLELEPVIAVEVGGEARAYPQKVLMFHEVVNDVVGGEPIAATW